MNLVLQTHCKYAILKLLERVTKKGSLKLTTSPTAPVPLNNYMILVSSRKSNDNQIKNAQNFTQELYDELISNIVTYLNQLRTIHPYIFWGAYTRSFVIPGGDTIELRIQRIYCLETKKTHALIPDFLVPYSRMPLSVQLLIIGNDEVLDAVIDEFIIDWMIIRHIRDNYRTFWKSKFPNWSNYNEIDITSICLNTYHRQFLQMRGICPS